MNSPLAVCHACLIIQIPLLFLLLPHPMIHHFDHDRGEMTERVMKNKVGNLSVHAMDLLMQAWQTLESLPTNVMPTVGYKD